jgi:chromosome segregation ATPase
MRQMTLLMVMVLLAAGCNATPREDPTSKREQDRLAMKLADAERERDELKGQIRTLATTTEQAITAQKTADAQAKRLEQELAAVRTELAAAAPLKTQLAEAQSKLADNTGRITELKTQVDALRTELAKSTSAATTQPVAPAMSK